MKQRHKMLKQLIDNRFMLGIVALITFISLLIAFSAELQFAYERLFLFKERNSIEFYLLFIIVLIAGCLTSVLPAAILGVFAGVFFNIFIGFLISSACFLVAALIAFFFARYFFRAASRRLVARFMPVMEAGLEKIGWKYALLIRLSPIAPFGITSYCLGLTPIKLSHYVLATLGAFPFLFACVYIGNATGVIVGEHREFDHQLLSHYALLSTSAAVLIALTMWLVPRLIQRRVVQKSGSAARLSDMCNGDLNSDLSKDSMRVSDG